MGWTFTHKAKSVSTGDFFASRFDYLREDGSSGKVLACKATLTEAYIAFEIKKQDTPARVVALVCLLQYVKDSYNFGFKGMDETMGPYYFGCPDSILNLLTPTENESALDWRTRCRELNKKNKDLMVGVTIEFESPLSFGVYGTDTTFECLDKKKNIYYAKNLSLSVKLAKQVLTSRPWRVL